MVWFLASYASLKKCAESIDEFGAHNNACTDGTCKLTFTVKGQSHEKSTCWRVNKFGGTVCNNFA